MSTNAMAVPIFVTRTLVRNRAGEGPSGSFSHRTAVKTP